MTQDIPSILQEIVAEKHREIKSRSEKSPLALIEHLIADSDDMPRGFYRALAEKATKGQNAVIAEIKKASPSKGVICQDFDPVRIAKSYELHGAACLSVLTDEKFFQGSEDYLDAAREAVSLPVIRKDFIVDAYQVYESRAMGADCILLIAACLSHEQMADLTALSYDFGMDVLIEVHNQEELDKVKGIPVRMLGINNRNLHTFEVDLQTTISLAANLPTDVNELLVITESGIAQKEDVVLMNNHQIYGFLVGESMMRHAEPGEKLSQLFNA